MERASSERFMNVSTIRVASGTLGFILTECQTNNFMGCNMASVKETCGILHRVRTIFTAIALEEVCLEEVECRLVRANDGEGAGEAEGVEDDFLEEAPE